MANLFDRFKNEVVGSESLLRDYLALISSEGDFKRVNDLNVILNSWNNILLTPRQTYLHDPEYGSDLYKYLFEPPDESTVEGVKREIEDRLMIYDDRAIIENIEVFIQADGKRFDIKVFVNYQGKKGTLDVSFDDNTFADFLTKVAT